MCQKLITISKTPSRLRRTPSINRGRASYSLSSVRITSSSSVYRGGGGEADGGVLDTSFLLTFLARGNRVTYVCN